MRWKPHIITTNAISGREYRLSDDRSRQWFIHYGPDGAGFGYLTWTCRRPIGFDWNDLGYGFPVVMYKGPFRVLFSGQIVKITEKTGPGGDSIEVWALGWIHTTTADMYNYIYCDNRLMLWEDSEDASGSFQPDKFDLDRNERLYLKPRRGVDFDANDYGRLRYTFEFGEVATRFVATYDLALPDSWPGKLEVRDSNGVVLWSATATASGSIDVTTTGAPTYFGVRFYVTQAGESTADDDTVYGELTDVKVYAVNVTTLDAKVIADDVVGTVLSGAGHGLGDDVSRIGAPGRALEPCYFDRDLTSGDVLTWCFKFGDSDDNPWVWGVSLDDARVLFAEQADYTAISYVIRPEKAVLERGGDWSESAQVGYAIYSDEMGDVHRTADYSSATMIAKLGGYYRRVAVQISGTNDPDQIANAMTLWLAARAPPIISGSFTIRQGVHKPSGQFVPYDEILPGGLVQVQEWRAIEATLAEDDYQDQKTTFPLAGVRVDEDAGTVELIPVTTSDAFARYMAVIQELIEASQSALD